MCGIIGISSKVNIAEDIYLGLIAMQHRGQDACGIASYDGERFYVKKGLGTVQSLFTGESLNRLKGSMGIGHVRYPTIGGGDPEDAQPFYINTPFGIAIAHNGNTINYASLRKTLTEKGRHINTSCDVEVLLNIFAEGLQDGDPFSAAERVMEEVKGSYSCVYYIARIGLFAFRDPHGIKPLILGHKNNSYAVASESVALDVLGYKIDKDIMSGEAILVDTNSKLTSKSIKQKAPKHCIFEYVYFARPDSVMDGIPIYEARFGLGRELAKEIKRRGLKPDVVIPVPDTARTTALSIAQNLRVPYREGLIKNRYIGRTFIMPRDSERPRKVRYKLNPVKQEIAGKKVLIVDDSIVRGNTSKAIVKLIREVGPKEVYFASSCPPLKYPCFYGIDMQTRGEFIARNKSVKEIQKEIGVDALVYQTLPGLISGVSGNPHNRQFCTACFNKEYPTEVTEEEVLEIEKDRTRS
jgi:amidophosphoribosyltransferase